MLIEVASHYRMYPKVSKELCVRQKDLSRPVKALSWRAQQRLHKRYLKLRMRRLHENKIKVAVARELAAFIWELAQRIEDSIRALRPERTGTSLQLHGGFSRPPLERSQAVADLYEMARSVAADLGHDLAEGSSGGGSDGNLTAALGIPTLDGLGAIGDGAHALHEHVEIAQLPWRAALLAGLIHRLDTC